MGAVLRPADIGEGVGNHHDPIELCRVERAQCDFISLLEPGGQIRAP